MNCYWFTFYMKVKNQYRPSVAWLFAGAALLFGKYAVSYLLSTKKKKESIKPISAAAYTHVQCPSGNRLYVEMDGPANAQAIVMIHGLQATRMQWYHQQKHFRDRYRVVMIDLPGHGRSDVAKSMLISDLADDLAHVLSQLLIKTPILYGHSIGGMTVLNYCIRHNNNSVKGIVVHNCSYINPLNTCLFPNFMQLIQKPVVVPYLNYVQKHPIMFRLLSRINYLTGLSALFYRYLLFTGQQSTRDLDKLSFMAAICPPEVAAAGVLSTLQLNLRSRLKQITAPCLVIGSLDDRIVRPEAAVFIADHVKNGQVRLIPGGHLNLIEYPDQVNAAIDNFIDLLA
jgi:pimeloyl-ACP methyl ester carboxylesterase